MYCVMHMYVCYTVCLYISDTWCSNLHMITFVSIGLCVCISQAGLAGDDAPSAVFPTLIGRPRHQVCM